MPPLYPDRLSDETSPPLAIGSDTPWTATDGAQHRLRAVFDSMSEGLVIHAPDGSIVDANRAAEQVLGLTRDQLLGKTSWDPAWRAICEDGTPLHVEDHPAVSTLRTGVAQRGFIMGIRIEGRPDRWISINTQPIRETGNDTPSGVVATFVDVTEQRQTIFDLQRARADLAAILENIPARVTAWNMDYTNRFANQRAEREWNLSPNGAFGRPVWEILGAERFARARPYIDAALAGTVRSHHQIDTQKDGSRQYSMVTYVPKVRDAQVVGLYALGFDITPLRLAQEALTETIEKLERSTAAAKDSEFRLRTIANGVPMTIALFDADERIVFANMEFGKLGDAHLSVEGRRAGEFFSTDLYERGRAARARALAGETVRFELTVTIDGEPRLREVTYSPYRDRDNRIVGVYALGYDVTEMHRSRERVRTLAQRIARDREGEKISLSTTLHERLAQDVFAAQLSLKSLDHVPAGGATWQATVGQISHALESIVGKLRQLTNDLVPISLANLPLATTLRLYAEDFGARFALRTRIDLSEPTSKLAPELRLLLFRALQQSLDNIQRHAMAASFHVNLSSDDSTVSLAILDDGTGIADAAIEKEGAHGLLYLSERFAAAGGTFRVRRADTGGTVVVATLPVHSHTGGPTQSATILP